VYLTQESIGKLYSNYTCEVAECKVSRSHLKSDIVKCAVKKTELLLAGRSKTQIFEDISSALDKKELPALESGAMCYMMSKQGYLSDRDGHWHPHLMFFVPLTGYASWGAGLPGSPVVVAFADIPERHTVFLVPVAKWSDGTADPTAEH